MNKIEYLVKKSYLIGLGFVASMVLLSGYLIVDSLGESEHHGHLINKSGYQRMLSQKFISCTFNAPSSI